ncbi:MAG: alpha/beta fold hydrolase, partial [Firmicutes bacterium]|nr:alpha/beta fold hydrolase [Bacillota bacterium]
MGKKLSMKAFILFLALLLVNPVKAQVVSELSGVWSGVLDLGTAELELIFRIESDSLGNYKGCLDVPAQGAAEIPLSFAGEKDGEIVLEAALIAGVFKGEFVDDALEGIWEQSGLKLPLTLEPREAEHIGFKRPQEPKPPYPYREEEVVYPNQEAGIDLAGTFTKPQGEGPFPAVILISGSGPQDRNEEIMGHKPFLVLADYLTRRGIAVLRVDDRGVGASGGDFAAATTLDFATDVAAGVEYLQTRKDVNPDQIGLIGHSEGGLIAPLVASDNPAVAFIVLMAAPGLNGEEISVLQSALIQKADGIPEDQIEREVELLQEVLAINRTEDNVEKIADLIREAILTRVAELSAEEQELVGD